MKVFYRRQYNAEMQRIDINCNECRQYNGGISYSDWPRVYNSLRMYVVWTKVKHISEEGKFSRNIIQYETSDRTDARINTIQC